MTDVITFTKLDGTADEILDAFQQRTGLHGEDHEQTRSFELHGREHELRIVETLTEIDEHWPVHVGIESP
jgi:hypothetical protein